MHNISDACKEALDRQWVSTKLSGTLKLNTGDVIQLSNGDFSKGALTVNSRSVSGSEFALGSVYAAELQAGITTDTDRYLFYGAELVLKTHIQLSDGTWEEIPMGKYTVKEPERRGKVVSLKAYDDMLRLDVPLKVTDVFGTPFELLSMLSEDTGVELAQSQEEIEAMPNGTAIFGMTVDEKTTYRDMLSDLSQLLCGFAVMDRTGKLAIRQYGHDPVYTATGRKKTGTSISDYLVRFCGVKAAIGGQTEAVYGESEEGQVLDLGSNQLLQYGTDDHHREVLEAILGEISQISYTPVSTSLLTGYPALDLGDMITVEDQYGESVNTYVMVTNWMYRGRHQIKGVGSNPNLISVRTQEDRKIDEVAGKIDAKDIIVHSFTNASDITLVSDKERELISINYAATTDTRAIFLATIPFSVDRDGYIVINYYIDGVLLEGDTLRQYVERGEHFVTISTNRAIEHNARATLSVRALTEYIESDIRQQSAKIASILDYIDTGTYSEQAIDTTAPKMTIAKQAIKAVLYAQGLSGAKEWDGTLNLVDEFAPVQLKPLAIRTMVDIVSTGLQVPMGNQITQSMARLQLKPLTLCGFAEQIGSATGVPIDFVVAQQTVEFGMTEYTEIVDGVTKLKTVYVVESVTEEIDTGYMSTVEIVTDGYQSVESVVVE